MTGAKASPGQAPGKAGRLAWAVTGSGHYLAECLELLRGLTEVDVFLSKAAAEVMRMYRYDLALPKGSRLYRDRTASAPVVGRFYSGVYRALVVAPTTSNTLAKFVYGISDTLVTNIFAQAGKCRVPIVVFACDTLPEMDTEAPHGTVRLWPRPLDLDITERARSMALTTVVDTFEQLTQTVAQL